MPVSSHWKEAQSFLPSFCGISGKGVKNSRTGGDETRVDITLFSASRYQHEPSPEPTPHRTSYLLLLSRLNESPLSADRDAHNTNRLGPDDKTSLDTSRVLKTGPVPKQPKWSATADRQHQYRLNFCMTFPFCYALRKRRQRPQRRFSSVGHDHLLSIPAVVQSDPWAGHRFNHILEGWILQ